MGVVVDGEDRDIVCVDISGESYQFAKSFGTHVLWPDVSRPFEPV